MNEGQPSSREFIIPARYDRISEVCEFVADGAEEAGFDSDQVFRIQLACDEACTNVIEHAYGAEGEGEIRVSCSFEAGTFTVVILDNGRAFDPKDIPAPVVPNNPDDLDKLQIGGLGVHFMRTLMDEVRFSFDKKGNRLVMVKYLTGDQAT